MKSLVLILPAALLLLVLPASAAFAAPCCFRQCDLDCVPGILPCAPSAVAVGADGTVFIADRSNHRILRLSRLGVSDVWGSAGRAQGRLIGPTALTLARDGSLLVGESGNGRVQVFSPSGASIAVWGESGSGPGRFGSVLALAIGEDGTVYALDAANPSLHRFSLDGEIISYWDLSTSGAGGTIRDGEDRFTSLGTGTPATVRNVPFSGRPAALAVLPGGDILIADAQSGAIRRYDPRGSFLGIWGADSNYAPMIQPAGLAVCGSGLVYASDSGTGSIRVHTADGFVLGEWSELVDPPTGPRVHLRPGADGIAVLEAASAPVERMHVPAALTVSSAGEIFAVDLQRPGLYGFAFPQCPRYAEWVVSPDACGESIADAAHATAVFALPGEPETDWRRIDPNSLRLGGGGKPLQVRFEDRWLYRDDAEDGCAFLAADGLADLIVEFDGGQIIEAAGRAIGESSLTLMGLFRDGTPFWGAPEVRLIPGAGFDGIRGDRERDRFARLDFDLPSAAPVRLDVFDVAGRRIDVALDDLLPAGTHTATWSAAGRPSGVYFLRLRAGDEVRNERFVWLR